eukprot:CAMPEP_0194768258 /NCGR_PEP_ID=MMETSP0323_2-20130528/39009_1 /TAXON_ID=2866 ORGANISM="Crypthecodinium cohnii, Strain Seligo" /NCGR_SAMPLE_ID=MMETSP0323_2 /ASSEMBLY_ACC=CAM_ASM_000346 /LENGTH=36 /DNA_ID= /DNA_START= /DNA_END= /DNA_ORIENTATION=
MTAGQTAEGRGGNAKSSLKAATPMTSQVAVTTSRRA